MEIKKSENAKTENKRSGLFQLGMIAALGFCLSAFEYTTAEKKLTVAYGTPITDVDPEPPLPPVKIKVPEPPKEEPRTRQNNSNPNAAPANPTTIVVSNLPTNPNQGIVTEPGDSIIIIGGGGGEPVFEPGEFFIVEDMPYFKDCSKIKNKKEREDCTTKMMYQFFGNNIKYPAIARENNIAGTVYVSFRINTAGEVDDVSVKKGVHEALDKEALRVVKNLPDFIPGEQRGKKVNVRYVIPIKFKLGD